MGLKTIEESVMVDTIGLRISDVDPSRLPKKFTQVGGDDSNKWAKGNLETDAGKVSLQVRGIKSKRECHICGSPAFHRQQHNIVSSNDVPMLSFAAVQDANKGLNLGIKYWRAAEFAQGRGLGVTRVDTPVLVRVPAGLPIGAVINGMALAGLLAGIDTSVYVGKSVYFDQHSQLFSLKGYDKMAEMRSRKRLQISETTNTNPLLALAATTIRLEAVYRQKYLKRRFADQDILLPADLTPDVLAKMFLELLARYDLKRELRSCLNQDELLVIPARYRRVVMSWQHGYDALKMLDNNKVEYSRAHGYLLKVHSIDIYGPPPVQIEERIELGDILSPANFLPIPAELRADPELFFSLDMEEERRKLDSRVAAANR